PRSSTSVPVPVSAAAAGAGAPADVLRLTLLPFLRGETPARIAQASRGCTTRPLRAPDTYIPLSGAGRSTARHSLGIDVQRVDGMRRCHEQPVALRAAETHIGA